MKWIVSLLVLVAVGAAGFAVGHDRASDSEPKLVAQTAADDAVAVDCSKRTDSPCDTGEPHAATSAGAPRQSAGFVRVDAPAVGAAGGSQ